METDSTINPNHGVPLNNHQKSPNSKPKIVVIMGASGTGKSRLAIDLASHFPIEIINADSMQVYKGLDVLTNKVPLHEQNGVPHHLLGTIDPNVEFTAKDFRDHAIPLINDIISRNHVPVLVGGTNYYIQALITPFLLDDSLEDLNDTDQVGDEQPETQPQCRSGNFSCNYETLKDLDPVAANRIHPNDYRKINQYFSLYARTGVLPSKLLQGKAMENWGSIDNFRYSCFLVCVDVSLPILDKFVEQRVDHMVDAGLLSEVYDIYNMNADYTRGLRQAIGVREFEEFLTVYLSKGGSSTEDDVMEASCTSINECDTMLKENMSAILTSSDKTPLKLLLLDAVDKVKVNTRKLVRRQFDVPFEGSIILRSSKSHQPGLFFALSNKLLGIPIKKRRLTRLQTLFGWNIHYVDATECLACMSDNSWTANVVEPSVQVIRSFLNEGTSLEVDSEAKDSNEGLKLTQRDLWTQYICKACGNKVLRGAYEWEQHKQGRSHRKRICKLRKAGTFGNEESPQSA